MNLLLTNDDGIEAPGMAALQRAMSPLGRTIVLAPETHLSGCSHQTTTHRPLVMRTLAPDQYALDGTPADCTRVALSHLVPELLPEIDWVISGINEGGNLGADVYPSGTVAAVREGVLLGKPGIAVSQYRRSRRPVDWERAARWTHAVISQLVMRDAPPRRFWNVNLPDPETDGPTPPVIFCDLDPNPLPVVYVVEEGRLHYRARYQDRLRHEGRDVDICFRGAISVTELSLG